MRTPWFVFLGLVSVALAEELPDQTAAEKAQEFLSLPEHDLVWVNPKPEKIQVGDILQFRIQDLNVREAGVSQVQVGLPEGSSSLFDQGWSTRFLIEESGEIRVYVTPVTKGTTGTPTFALVDQNDKPFARVRPLSLAVASAFKPGEDPKKAKPPELIQPLGLPFPQWVIFLIAGVALLILLIGVYYLIRWSQKSRKLPPVQIQAPPKPEDVEALAALEELRKRNWVDQREYKVFYFGISEILKHYMGRRYRVLAQESTTYELMELLRAKHLSDKFLVEVQTIFDHLDLIKFTDTEPTSAQAERVFDEAVRFVRNTRRPPKVTEKKDAV